MPPRTLLVLLSMVSLPAAFAADRLAPSDQPPGGLKPAEVPQFILLGFDDNPDAEPVNWVVNYLDAKRNPAGAGQAATLDGAPVRMIFFSNGRHWKNRDTVAAHQRALAAGHEIANHTQNHDHGRAFTTGQWKKEIALCDEVYTANAIPPAGVIGYRAPFLEYNDDMFTALAATGRRYDSSIEEGDVPTQDGTNYVWPYTLDDGSPGNAASFHAGDTRLVGRHPGLWEIPLHLLLIPADADCERYGATPGLRVRIGATLKQSYGSGSGEPAGKITGLDWNVFEAAKCTGAEFLAILKYTLDRRLAGNRAPFMVGGHTALYALDKPDRRQALEEFVAYALSKPEVRFATGGQLLEWLRAPEALK